MSNQAELKGITLAKVILDDPAPSPPASGPNTHQGAQLRLEGPPS